MLTDAQFHLRVLEELLKYNSIQNETHLLFEADDLREYMKHRYGVVPDDEDDDHDSFEKQHDAVEQIELTVHGFVQALGHRAGIDLKFMQD
jgi:hypothetical protein